MSSAIKIYQGRFGRIALLDMDAPLIAHAHHHCHVLIKAAGVDTYFGIHDAIHQMTSQTAVLINSWEPHAYRHHCMPGSRTVILALYVEPVWLSEIRHPLGSLSNSRCFPSNTVRLKTTTRKLADELVNEMCRSCGIAVQRLEGLLFDLMISLVESMSDWQAFASVMRSANGRFSDRRIRRATAYLRQHAGADVEMEKVAAQCGLSRAHFFALFRHCTSLTPQVYANVLKMEAAIANLSRGEKSLTRISQEIGFSAPSHFTRFFRQHLGIKPSEYRRVLDLFDDVNERPVEI